MKPRGPVPLPQPSRPAASTGYEYRTETMDRDADLNQFASEGWELVAVTPWMIDQAVFYFKRAIR